MRKTKDLLTINRNIFSCDRCKKYSIVLYCCLMKFLLVIIIIIIHLINEDTENCFEKIIDTRFSDKKVE